jgi:hypothetical protein
MSSDLLLFVAGAAPVVAPRTYRGNMCGVRVPGLPPVPGGAADPALVLSWFYDRYGPVDRAAIRAVWAARCALDVLLSWPDSEAIGQSPSQFVGTCRELVADDFLPCVFLSAKPTSSADIRDLPGTLANILQVLPLLIASGCAPRICIGWELSLWLSPEDVQSLIDAIAPLCTPHGIKVYVHFQEGYFAYQPNGGVTADFWNANVGKLTGVLHQRDLAWDMPMYQARIVDCLERFSGRDGFVVDSGFGHPFDFIALEITAQPQFNGEMDEATGNAWGQTALGTPTVSGVSVMGSGNGQ